MKFDVLYLIVGLCWLAIVGVVTLLVFVVAESDRHLDDPLQYKIPDCDRNTNIMYHETPVVGDRANIVIHAYELHGWQDIKQRVTMGWGGGTIVGASCPEAAS